MADLRLTTAVEHWDQAVCFGIRYGTTRYGTTALTLYVLATLAVSYMHGWGYLALLAVPLVMFGFWCRARAQLRQETWTSVEEAIEAMGGKPYDRRAGQR